MNTDLLLQLLNKNHSYDYAKTESPIERFLLNHIIKFLSIDTKVEVQYPIETLSGNFRADIALIRKDKIIILECDGKEHHTSEIDDWYDEWRDTLILVQRKANVIYRIKGKDIYNNIYSVFSIINHFDYEIFDSTKLERLNIIEVYDDSCKKNTNLSFVNEYDETIPYRLELKRKDIYKDFDKFWLKYVMYSMLYSDKNIYQLIEMMKSKDYDTKELIRIINKNNQELNLQDEKQLLTWVLPIVGPKE